MHKISIIIPVFNRAHCIGRALNSIMNQCVGDCELIIGDDASTDGTWEVVRHQFPAARLARLDRNSGAAAARNAALRLATGDFIAFLDSDDEWLPGKLATQMDYLQLNPDVAACVTSHFYQLRNGSRRTVLVENPPTWGVRLHSEQPFHGASSPVVRRSVLESIGFQDESLRVLEDWDWMLRMAQTLRIHALSEPLALIHENAPSNADFTLLSTERFLAKHDAAFLSIGEKHRRDVVSQHWENAARCFFRHSRNSEGCRCLWKSLQASAFRNPSLISAFPLAAMDGLFRTRFLRRLLAARGRLSIV